MAEDLRVLAADFVRLSGELEATRAAMKRLLMNGAGEPARHPMGARLKPGANALQAREAEGEIVELLKGRPGLRTSEIARATSAKAVTVQDRLRRLKKRGEVQGEGGGWVAATV